MQKTKKLKRHPIVFGFKAGCVRTPVEKQWGPSESFVFFALSCP